MVDGHAQDPVPRTLNNGSVTGETQSQKVPLRKYCAGPAPLSSIIILVPTPSKVNPVCIVARNDPKPGGEQVRPSGNISPIQLQKDAPDDENRHISLFPVAASWVQLQVPSPNPVRSTSIADALMPPGQCEQGLVGITVPVPVPVSIGHGQSGQVTTLPPLSITTLPPFIQGRNDTMGTLRIGDRVY